MTLSQTGKNEKNEKTEKKMTKEKLVSPLLVQILLMFARVD
jgi:hypothetical protein